MSKECCKEEDKCHCNEHEVCECEKDCNCEKDCCCEEDCDCGEDCCCDEDCNCENVPTIIVIGSESEECKTLYSNIIEILEELQLDANIGVIEDSELGDDIRVPALVINNKIQFIAENKTKEELMEYFENIEEQGCSCGCN